MTKDMVAKLNAYVRANVKSNNTPYGWGICGRHANIVHYLARFGVGDIYIDYNEETGEIVGYILD